MSENQNWNNMGEQFKGVLSDALRTGDFRNLNDLVNQTVSNTLNEVGKYITPRERGEQRKNRYGSDVPPEQQWDSERGKQEQARAQQNEQARWQKEQVQRRQPAQTGHMEYRPLIKVRKVGSVSNVLYQVFGGIGLGVAGIAAFVRLLVFFAGATTVSGWIVNFIVLAIFFGMVRLGIGQRRRLKRAERYVQLCDSGMYGEIEDLARGTGKSERYVAKDLQKMLELGMFPEGHLDEQKTCFMLNDEVYRQYLKAEDSRRIREEDSRKSQEQKKSSQMPKGESAPDESEEREAELDTMVSEGMECIRKLRVLNDRISGEVISGKLSRLENLLNDIFASVREHPEQMHRMHKLMDYYLPTTLKLVEAYEEFDRVKTPGEEIIEAKAEIENTLDTINQALTELLNNLFQDAVFDATTDAQVLKSMLAREGLTREMEFKEDIM